MDSKHPNRFQISMDDDTTQAVMRDELQELKIEKLSTRVTLLTILIPCIIGIILVIAYLDIKDRVMQTQDTGSSGVQKLSKDLESKFSSLSLQQAKINDTLSSRFPPLEEKTDALEVRLNQLNNAVKKLKSAALDENDLQNIVDRFNESYADLPERLVQNTERLKSLQQHLKEETEIRSRDFEGLLGTLNETRQSLKTVKTETDRLATEKLSKKEMELALRLKEMALQQEFREALADMEKRLSTLQEKVQTLRSASGGDTPAAAAGQPTDNTPPAETADVEAGVIVEQPLE